MQELCQFNLPLKINDILARNSFCHLSLRKFASIVFDLLVKLYAI